MADNIELSKLELEKARFQEELKLKATELDLKLAKLEFQIAEETKKPRSFSPLTITVLTGFIGIISLGIANYLQSSANFRLEREKFDFNAKLEREKFESALILKAIETGNPETATKNLLFLVRTGLIKDQTGKIIALEGKPENAPVLPLPGKTTNEVGDRNCGEWQSESSGKRYTFICNGDNLVDVYENDPKEGLIKVGSGTMSEGKVRLFFIPRERGRGAFLELLLSTETQTLEGSFQGAEPREAGPLRFRKVD